MLKRLPTLVALIFTVSLICSAQTGFDPDTSLKDLSGSKKNIGIAAAYSIDYRIEWSGAAGLLCESTNDAFTTKSLTRIASISKPLTAVAVLQLVERDLIGLDQPIDNYLPALPTDKRKVTVRQLLNHTSGIPQYADEKEIENKTNYASLDEAMKIFIERPLIFEPGTRYFYTTYGYVVLGRIIEEVSGMSYAEYMRQYILEPADMQSTDIERPDQRYSDKSCLYHHNGRKAKEADQNNLSNRIPGGGYISTVEDLLKFGHALLNENLITAESLSIMLQKEDVDYDSNPYGLGWYLYGPPPNEDLVIGHGGGQTGCTSQLMIVPKTKTVVVVLSNTSGRYPEIAGFTSKLLTHSEKNK